MRGDCGPRDSTRQNFGRERGSSNGKFVSNALGYLCDWLPDVVAISPLMT